MELELIDKFLNNGVTLSGALNDVSKEKGISTSALKSRYHRKISEKSENHRNSALNEEQDELLLYTTIAFSAANTPIAPSRIKDVVFTLFGIKVSKMWTSRWIKSHKNFISVRKSKYLANKRIDSSIYDEVLGFLACVEHQQEKIGYTEAAVINYDETRICAGESGEFVLHWNEKERTNAIGIRASSLATLLIFISASGNVICDMIIIKGKSENEEKNLFAEFRIPKLNEHETRSKITWPRFYAVTE